MNLVAPERLKRGPPRAHKVDGVDTRALWKKLRQTVEGEVRFDQSSLGLYAQDASNYYHVPIGIVLPRHANDVAATIAACREVGAPIVGRTGGTGLAGQGCNEAVVMDYSKYMRHIVELDPKRRVARVEPGVVCDELSHAAKPYLLDWGPKPATHSRCGFGGMLSNNCGGMNAQYAGIAVHNVEALDVVLYDGTRMHLGWIDEHEFHQAAQRNDASGRVHQRLRELRDRYATLIKERYPRLPRRVSGYNLDQLLPGADGRINLARTIVGTEGTCVSIVEATVRLVDLRPERVVVMLGYKDVFEAADHVPALLAAAPDAMAIEGMDQRLYDHTRKKAAPTAKYLDLLPRGHGWLFVQLGADDRATAIARGHELLARVRHDTVDAKLVDDVKDQQHFWAMREDGLGATAFVPGEADTWEGWEDSAVPPERLGAYLRDLDALYEKYGYSSPLYGHFGQGLVHCRVNFDLVNKSGVEHFHAFLDEATTLVAVKYRGSLSGEHGDGQSKAEFLEKMFGRELVGAFAEFKAIWDPAGKMNPGKIVSPHRADQDLRLGAHYDPATPATHFQFPADKGSFAHATLRCVGIGKCRNLDSSEGVMCPSYMVTQEERDSTRGRAHLLWEMLRGGRSHDVALIGQEEVKESLDLCLACKGCKGDCPVNVDIATYKAEFLSRYYQAHARPRHAYAFGLIDTWARLTSPIAGLANLVTSMPGTRTLAKLAMGVHPDRKLPSFAPQTFREWFQRRPPPTADCSGEGVLLWVDTFNDHFRPETSRAAVEVLEHLGFRVHIPDRPLCCGRPLYDFGMLDRAKRYLENTMTALAPHIDAGLQMIVLEPSCASVFRDELVELFPTRAAAQRLRDQTLTLSEFLDRRVPKERIPKLRRKAMVQTHCHHHSVLGFDPEEVVFKAMELDTETLRSGCCGMAGSFGFQKDTHAVGQACGERVLLPRVREASPDTLILADGFSCKTQIEQGTKRRALHLAEALALALRDGQEGPIASPFVESTYAAEIGLAIRRSQKHATVFLLVALAVVLATLAVLIGSLR